jgi:hypothetical protein
MAQQVERWYMLLGGGLPLGETSSCSCQDGWDIQRIDSEDV